MDLKLYHEFALLVGTLTNESDYKTNSYMLTIVPEDIRFIFVRLVTIGVHIPKAFDTCVEIRGIAEQYNITFDQVFEAVIKQLK